MNQAFRRRGVRPRPRVEALEPRALLAVAGSLDPSFGNGHGTATAPLNVPVISLYFSSGYPLYIPESAGFTAQASSVEPLPDGGVVVSGPITYSSNSANNSSSSFAISERNADGSPIASFGVDGEAQIPTYQGGTFKVAVQPNGQLLLVSSKTDSSGNATYDVARLDAKGALDTTFGTGGIAEYPSGTMTPAADRLGRIAGVFVQSSGQILLAGSSQGGFSAVELNPDGSLDTSYGTDGTATVSATIADSGEVGVSAAAMQADGQIVLVGGIATTTKLANGIVIPSDTIALTRLNADGTLDPTFGGATAAGVVLLPLDPSNLSAIGENNATSLAVQPTTGDILVEGTQQPTGDLDQSDTLYRLTADGALDTSFGTNGLLMPFPATSNLGPASTMVVEADGDIVLGGFAPDTPPDGLELSRVGLLRLDPEGTPDASFGNSSTPGVLLTDLTTFSFSNTTPTPTPVISPTTGDILLAGTGTVPTLAGLTYGFTVDSILAAETTGPSASPSPPVPPADFSGQGYSDAAIYDPASGSFITKEAIPTPGLGSAIFAFGPTGAGQAIPAAADYDGLGYDQVAAYLPASGVYAVHPVADVSAGLFEPFGVPGAGQSIPVPADYYGTGQADVAVYLTASGVFAIQDPTGKTSGEEIAFGSAGLGQSIPVPGYYDGDGRDDIAVYLVQAGAFAIQGTAGLPGEIVPFGIAGAGQSLPVPGDYDGSGKTELAVYIPSQGAFYYRSAKGAGDVEIKIGTANSGEIPVPGDYDGSGRTEAAVYSPSGGFIIYAPAKGGPDVTIDLDSGNSGSIPVATPAGDLPEFAAPGSGTKAKAVVLPSASSGSTASTSAITLSGRSAAPSGPTPASIRVARTLVNQEAPDPLKFVSRPEGPGER